MTKAELVEKMAKDAGISKVAAKAAMESFLDGVKKGLKKRNSRVTLVGFGTFTTRINELALMGMSVRF